MPGAGATDSCFTAPISGRYFGRPVFIPPPGLIISKLPYVLNFYVPDSFFLNLLLCSIGSIFLRT